MRKPLIASHSTELPVGTAPEWVQLLPYGTFEGRDGRGPYTLRDAAHAAEVITRTRAYQRGADVPGDYDHQLLWARENGKPAPASGWAKEFAARPDGLYARIEWTAAAAEQISSRAYRYLSPVFSHLADGTVTRIVAFGLSNRPNLELTALASSCLFIDHEDFMNEEQLKKLLVALGLPEGTTAEQLTAHCQGMATSATAIAAAAKALAPAVGKPATAKPEEVLTAASACFTSLAATLKVEPTFEKIAAAAQGAGANGSDVPDPAKFVPMEAFKELQEKVAAMSQSLATDKAAEEIAKAKASGKLAPAMESWAKDYAAKDLDGFVTWASQAPVIVTPAKGGTSSGVRVPGANADGLSEEELAVCSQLRLTVEQFKKTKGDN